LLCFAATSPCFSQDDSLLVVPTIEKKNTARKFDLATAKEDSSQVVLRKFDTQTIATYKADKDFQYEKDNPKNISLWQAFKNWLFRKLLGMEISESAGDNIENTIYFFLALVMLWAMVKLINADVFSIFYIGNKSQSTQLTGEWLTDNIHGIDFDKQITEAVNQKNYRIAVRLFYLYTLKKLADKQLIAWEINKTNHDYTTELSNSAAGSRLHQDFEQATYYFEYVWYGDFKVNDSQFEKAKLLYEQFMQKIDSTKK
jgi:hypothetical protein